MLLPASVDLRGAPPSSPHLLPRKRLQGRCHTLWPRARSPKASAPSPSPRGRPSPPLPSPPGSGVAARSYLHISTFVPCRRPISAPGEAGGLGGAQAPAPAAAAAGSRAGRSRPGVAAQCSRSPGLTARICVSAWLRPGPDARTKRLSARLRRSQIYLQLPGTTGSNMVCGGFACSKNCLCALNLLYTVSMRSLFLPVWGLCTCSGFSWLPCLAGGSLTASRAPFPSSHALRAPGLAISPQWGPGADACRSLFVFLIVKPVLLARWPRLCHIALPRPSPTALFCSHFTRPSHFPILIPSAALSWLPNLSGAGLEVGEPPWFPGQFCRNSVI